MADSQLFEDTFTITKIDDKKYDRVSRLHSNTDTGDTELHLDVNHEVYPIAIGDRLHITLASTLSLDGSNDQGSGWRDVGRGASTLADFYEYVCHGKIYRFEEGEGDNMFVNPFNESLSGMNEEGLVLIILQNLARSLSRVVDYYFT